MTTTIDGYTITGTPAEIEEFIKLHNRCGGYSIGTPKLPDDISAPRFPDDIPFPSPFPEEMDDVPHITTYPWKSPKEILCSSTNEAKTK